MHRSSVSRPVSDCVGEVNSHLTTTIPVRQDRLPIFKSIQGEHTFYMAGEELRYMAALCAMTWFAEATVPALERSQKLCKIALVLFRQPAEIPVLMASDPSNGCRTDTPHQERAVTPGEPDWPVSRRTKQAGQ